MQISIISPAITLALLASGVNAWYGQLSDSATQNEGGVYKTISLIDYTTGSTYQCNPVWSAWDVCTYDRPCQPYCFETSAGDYSFTPKFWKTDDGCHNVDFNGAFDAHHGYCCGSLPCNLSA